MGHAPSRGDNLQRRFGRIGLEESLIPEFVVQPLRQKSEINCRSKQNIPASLHLEAAGADHQGSGKPSKRVINGGVLSGNQRAVYGSSTQKTQRR